MSVDKIMTHLPACCVRETSLEQVAKLMAQHDCGAIPVVDGVQSMHPIGIVTDRDIVCRTVARGRNPLNVRVVDCMTHPVVTLRRGATELECVALMEKHAIRRVVVVDDTGRCCGIVAQADIAEKVPQEHQIAHLLHEVSRP